MKLNLGSGNIVKQGYVNVDVTQYPGVDQVVDLDKVPWPWEDNSVDEIYASDALEHFAPLGRGAGQLNIIAIMGEIHRVLKPGGLVELIIPSTDGPGAFQDPTHVTYWNKNTFLYFVKESPYTIPGAEGFPQFTVGARDLGIADSDIDQFGVVWACARLRKPELEAVPTGEGAAEGADAE